MKRILTAFAAFTIGCPAVFGAQASTDQAPVVGVSEAQDRRVDQAALDSQNAAIRQLQALLKQKRGKDREPQLLYKLGSAYERAAQINFRIAHGSALRKEAKANLSSYQVSLKRCSEIMSELIARFPGFKEMPRVYYVRAKARQEIGDLPRAISDYQYLVRHYPQSDNALSAYMALGQIAMDRGEFARAVDAFVFVEKSPQSSHYPHALYRLAWCHYNLKDVPKALSYIGRNIGYYSNHTKNQSDAALRENALLDSTLFFLEGREQKLANFEVPDALAYFHRLESGPILGRMLVRYAKLLRSHGHEADLAAWKDAVLRMDGARPEAFEIIIIAFENQLNKRNYASLVATANDFVKYQNSRNTAESQEQAQRLLLKTAEQLQVLISRNKDADGVTALTTALAGIYGAFTKIVSESDPRIPKVHFNLAESLFEIRQYEQATTHYRWIVEHGKDEASVANASLRAIGSRYEVLRKRGIIPGELKAKPLSAPRGKALDVLLGEWIGWVETHQELAGMTTVDNFYFEANRALYANWDVQEATKRLREFALKYPRSKFATPSATLVVDTIVASSDWKQLHELLAEFLSVKEWKGSDFSRKLYALASDADYKEIEGAYQSKEYQSAIAKAEDFLKAFPQSKRKTEALSLAGHSALAKGDHETALRYLGQIEKSVPGTEAAVSALLARASIYEERYDHVAATQAYQAYLAVPPSQTHLSDGQRNNIRRKTLAFAWMSGERKELMSLLNSPKICAPALQVDCDRYQALLLLSGSSPGPQATSKAFASARRGPSANRALWAAVALEGARNLPFRDRHVAIRLLSSNWQEADALARFSLISPISESVPRAIAYNRRDLRDVAPLLAREAYLVRRVEAVREIENAVSAAMKLPFARLRASVTNELAETYAEMAKQLQSLRGADPAMGTPFGKKAAELRGKALELASKDTIASVDLRLLSSLDPSGDWNDKAECTQPESCLKSEWVRAARAKRWQETAYLLQRAKEKSLIPPGTQSLLRAVTLAGAGAKAEALAELADARKSVSSSTRRSIDSLLAENSQNSLSKKEVQ